MATGSRAVHEYNELIARAFNGAVEVDGQRIVAHPSGLLWLRSPHREVAQPLEPRLLAAPDRDNDWSDV